MNFNSVVWFRELRILDINRDRDSPPNRVVSSRALPGHDFTRLKHLGQRLAYGLAEQWWNRVSDLFDYL